MHSILYGNRLYKNTSLSGKAGDVLETLTNITSKDQLACMCQGCLSSGPLKVWATISHSTLNVKCLTPDCWEVGFRPSEPVVPVFMFIFRLLILPLIQPKQPDQSRRCGSACKSQSPRILMGADPAPRRAKTVTLPIPHFFPSINHWQQKRKELRWGDPLIQAGCLHILKASLAVHPWFIWSKSDQEYQFICLSRIGAAHTAQQLATSVNYKINYKINKSQSAPVGMSDWPLTYKSCRSQPAEISLVISSSATVVLDYWQPSIDPVTQRLVLSGLPTPDVLREINLC